MVSTVATWSRVMTKKRECKAAVLTNLDAPDSELITATLAFNCIWKTENKEECSKARLINKLMADAKKDDERRRGTKSNYNN